MDYKKIYLVLGIFLVLCVISGGTFGFYKWESLENQNTEIIFTEEEPFRCSVDGGGNITHNDVELVPTTCDNSEYAIKREIKVMPTIYGETPILMDLWLDVNSIGSGLSESVNFRYALTTNPYSCTQDLVRMGNFNAKVGGDRVELLNSIGYVNTTTDTYYLYVWLDKEQKTFETMGQSFDLSLNGVCTNAPEPQTYIAFSEEDSTLRLFKRDESTSPVSNNGDLNILSNLNNTNSNYEIETVDDVTVTENNKTYLDLETTNFTSAEQLPWYEYRDSITRIVIEDEIKPISLAHWFEGLTNVEYIDVSKLNTYKVTDMKNAFDNTGLNATSFEIIGLNNWSTSNVTSMHNMFHYAGKNATAFNIGDLSNWDVSNVKEMGAMFYYLGYNAGSFNIGNIGNWDVSNVNYMYGMFKHVGENATTFNIGDLSDWNVSNVKDMSNMFGSVGASVTTFNIGDLSNWDVSNVNDMNNMFNAAGYDAETFNIGDLSNWNVSNVTNMNGMFLTVGENATTFNIGDLSDWDTSNVTNMSYMFSCVGKNSIYFNIGNIGEWDVSNVTDMSYMFYQAGENVTTFNIGDLSGWDVSSVTNVNRMFGYAGRYATTFNIGNLNNWNTSSITIMENMFAAAGQNATTFNIGDISGWDTSNVTNMKRMFDSTGQNASNWSLDLSGWNVNKVTSYSLFNSNVTNKVTPPTWVNDDVES